MVGLENHAGQHRFLSTTEASSKPVLPLAFPGRNVAKEDDQLNSFTERRDAAWKWRSPGTHRSHYLTTGALIYDSLSFRKFQWERAAMRCDTLGAAPSR